MRISPRAFAVTQPGGAGGLYADNNGETMVMPVVLATADGRTWAARRWRGERGPQPGQALTVTVHFVNFGLLAASNARVSVSPGLGLTVLSRPPSPLAPSYSW